MANNKRKILPTHSDLLAQLILTAPSGIQLKGGDWKAIVTDPSSGERRSRYFSARTLGHAEARRRAIAWSEGKPVPAPRDGLPLVGSGGRRFGLTRRQLKGRRSMRYELAIQASKAEARFSWMRRYLGTSRTVTQEKIDSAIATLELRWRVYQHNKLLGREEAAAMAKKMTVNHAPAQRRLLLADLLRWTGNSDEVSFFGQATE